MFLDPAKTTEHVQDSRPIFSRPASLPPLPALAASGSGIPLLKQKTEAGKSIEISPKEVRGLMDSSQVTLIDVREPYERDKAKIEPSVFIPLGELPEKMKGMDKSKTVVAYCHTGVRSAFAAEMMRNAGFSQAYSMAGGIDEWSSKIDPKVPKY